MTQAGEQLAGAIEAVLEACGDLAQGLARLIDVLARQLESSRYADGCPIATVALEASGESEPIRAAAACAFDSWLSALERADRRRRASSAPPPRAARCSCSARSRAR